MAGTNGTTNGDARKPASFLEDIITVENAQSRDIARDIPGMPPNMGQYPVQHIGTFQGYVSTVSSIYRDYDEAVQHSLDAARYMRNDCGIMESLEARQRATALLDWHIEPENEKSQEQKDLCEALTKIMERIRRFTEYRYNLLHALWYGKYGIQHRYGHQNVAGNLRKMPCPERENPGWLPVNGDKIVQRYKTDRLRMGQFPHQVGIRVGPGHTHGQTFEDPTGTIRKVEATDRGLAYFLSDAERKLLSIHRHSIEDGSFEDPISAGVVQGVGIRSRIYWDWVQKQESLGFLIEYLERSAGGIELWKYPQGNAQAKADTEAAARARVGGKRNIMLVPMPPGEEGFQYGVEVIEPGMVGVEQMQNLVTSYFGHRIKRYILGQILSSEAEATGLGSGVADLHWTTFLQIIHYDAGNLEETITNDLLRNLQLWNFPKSAHIHLEFRIDTEQPDQEKRLAALKSAWEIGARIKEGDVLEVVGAAVPGPDDKALVNPQITQAEQQMQMQQQQQQMQQQQAEQQRATAGSTQAFRERFIDAMGGRRPDPQWDEQQMLQALPTRDEDAETGLYARDGEPDRYAENCGTGAGGFKQGNTCGASGSGGGTAQSPDKLPDFNIESARAILKKHDGDARQLSAYIGRAIDHANKRGFDAVYEFLETDGSVGKSVRVGPDLKDDKGQTWGAMWIGNGAARVRFVKKQPHSRGDEPDRYRYMIHDADLRDAIAHAAEETDTEPSEAAREAGNYRKGKFHAHGMEIAIENPRGSIRRGKNRLGVEWAVEMPCHYGYIRRTVSEADGDHVDCFIGPNPESEIVYVVDQQTPGGKFDEHKCLLGFASEREARACYLSAYTKGWTGLRDITPMTMQQFKAWLEKGTTKKPLAAQVSKYRFAEEDHPRDGDGKFAEKPGGKTAKAETGTGEKAKAPESVQISAKKLGERWYAMADLPDGRQVTRSAEDQQDALDLAAEDIIDAGYNAAYLGENSSPSTDSSSPLPGSSSPSTGLHKPADPPENAPPPMVPKLPGASRPLEKLHAGQYAGKVGSTVMHVSDIKSDPARFQFKVSGIDPKTGVTKELQQVGSWNPILAGVVTVWQDPADGQTYIVNGHHRYELSQRAIGADLAKLPAGMAHDSAFSDANGKYNGALAVQYLDAGTAQQARSMGALTNIAEGRGSALDAAKFMRDTGIDPQEMGEYGISLSGRVARDGASLSGLSDSLFDRLTRGMVSENRALAIADNLADHDKQNELWGLIDRAEQNRPLTDAAVAEMARELDVTPTTMEQGGLFGGFERSLIAERGQLKASLRRHFSSVRNAFKQVSSDKRGEILGEAGNVIDTGANRERAQQADELLWDFDKRVNAKGDPIAQAVSDASERLAANPKQFKRIESELLGRIQRLVDGGGAQASPARDPEAPGDGGAGGMPRSAAAFSRESVDRAVDRAVDRYGLSYDEAAELRRHAYRTIQISS